MLSKISIRSFFPLLLLLIPFMAMQITDQVDWSLFDFLIMGLLLFLVGTGIDFILRKNKSSQKRLLFITLIIICFLLIWAELAVGIFETSFAGN